MDSDTLSSIARADVRRFEQSGTAVEDYIGIQRKLDPDRRKKIGDYVNETDATFPTSVVIAVPNDRCLEFDETSGVLTFFSIDGEGEDNIARADIASILDGQHRLAGLAAGEKVMDLAVTVFPSIDIAEQAYIFATVNLAQTKVNPSLALDLLAYARSRSPERTCHDVAVALNATTGSPFFETIKRLGSKTPGVEGETLSQATFVRSLLPYISREPRRDREDLRRGIRVPAVRTRAEFEKTPLRNYFVTEQDGQISDIIWDYFDAVRARWDVAWDNPETGQIIKRTNGFRAFMNVFGMAFLALNGSDLHKPSVQDYLNIWKFSNLRDEDFNREMFLPGTSGERLLTSRLQSTVQIFLTKKRAG